MSAISSPAICVRPTKGFFSPISLITCKVPSPINFIWPFSSVINSPFSFINPFIFFSSTAPKYPFTSPFLFPVAIIFPYGPFPFIFNVIRSLSPFKSFPIMAVTVSSFPNNVAATGSVLCIFFASLTISVVSHTKNLAHLLVPLISFDLFSIILFPFPFVYFQLKISPTFTAYAI